MVKFLADTGYFQNADGTISNIVEVQNQFIVATANQTVFTLTTTPSINCIPELILNNLPMIPGTNNDYTITNNILTFNYGLDIGDDIVIDYF